jgi:hypothetical protein
VLPGKPGPFRYQPAQFRKAAGAGRIRGVQVRQIRAALERLFA